jgi:hypothetical protein
MLEQMQNIRLVMLRYVLIFSIFANGYVGVNAEHSAGDAKVNVKHTTGDVVTVSIDLSHLGYRSITSRMFCICSNIAVSKDDKDKKLL